MSNKILTANPESELFEVTQRGTYHLDASTARGVVTLPHTQGVVAYSALSDAGLFVTDIGPNTPELPDSKRVKEPMLAGNYYDVATFADRLLALNHDTHQREIIDPSLISSWCVS